MTPTTLDPAPTREANTTRRLIDPDLVGGATDQLGPVEGRGCQFPKQRFAQQCIKTFFGNIHQDCVLSCGQPDRAVAVFVGEPPELA